MKHYAAFLEGLTPIQEKQLTSFLFHLLCNHLQKKSKQQFLKIDISHEKIWLKARLFFHFDKKTRLLETECVQACKAALIEVNNVLLYPACIDFFKNLKFATSEEEALMLSDNGLLFSQTSRIHKSKNSKKLVLFNGIVSSEFAINQILNVNPGLIFGHAHNDTASYAELTRLLPTCKLQNIKILYLELPYSIFSPLFSDFNQKTSNHKHIITQLKKGIKLYQDKTFLKSFAALLLGARDHGIAIQACDVNSLNFINYSKQLIDGKHRLGVGNACMIRTIEALQYRQAHPKFLLLAGLAHANSIADELGVPCCYIGEKKTFLNFPDLSLLVDYEFFTDSRILHSSESSFFMKIGTRLDQTNDPKISAIIIHWNELIKQIPRFSSIAAREIKAAREVYIEHILEKSQCDKREISDICKNQQSLIIASLTQATYSKGVELAHPKNWYPLFYCQRPYGIRLADNENYAFTPAHLKALETSPTEAETSITKLHYA
ncbi:MAG: hypothetical protein RJA83_60 [Pseudomonadota bacterium]|jgi:hypothetical protein